METKFCIAHNYNHEEESWRWHSTKINRKKAYYCHQAIYCIGCKEVHLTDRFSRLTPQGWLCIKWTRPANLTPEQKAKNMSPEEVMSGVHLGASMLPQFKGKSSNNFSEDHRREVKALKEALG